MKAVQDISTFNFSPSDLSLLISNGFSSTEDFQGFSVLELAKELNVDNQKAMYILEKINVNKTNIPTQNQGKSVLEMIQQPINSIFTFSRQLDEMLDGGIPLKQITEFCGVPGIGKTQIGIQLAVNAHLPAYLNGVEGESIYIDTEGSFEAIRVKSVATHFLEHVTSIKCNQQEELGEGEGKEDREGEQIKAEGRGEREGEEDEEEKKEMKVEDIMKGIYCMRVYDYIQQLAVIYSLPSFLISHPKVRCIILDSVAFHFRKDFKKDYYTRTRLLNSMAQKLLQIAENFNIAVVLLNQVTTKIGEDSKSSVLVPALGESWGHSCNNRIILYWENNSRCAYLYKSPNLKNSSVKFSVDQRGIRSSNEEEQEANNQNLNIEN